MAMISKRVPRPARSLRHLRHEPIVFVLARAAILPICKRPEQIDVTGADTDCENALYLNVMLASLKYV